VARGIPVAKTRPARLIGPTAARASRTETALPSEPVPCRLSPITKLYLTMWDKIEKEA
jgi:hypothetical protein